MKCQLQKDLLLRTPFFFGSSNFQNFYKSESQVQKFKKKTNSNVWNPFNFRKYNAPNIFFFFNFFSALYKFWNVLIVYYYVTYFKFYLYFILAKEEHKV